MNNICEEKKGNTMRAGITPAASGTGRPAGASGTGSAASSGTGGAAGASATGPAAASGTGGISGSTLKIIAIVAMLIDHIGAAVLYPYLLIPGHNTQEMVDLYYFMRLVIGRAAFPIFCFLLTEGAVHTSNIGKYALRLGIFALISDIPFDLALFQKLPDWEHQNVFFTLFLGLLAIWAWQKLWESDLPKPLQWVLGLLASAAFMGLAEFLGTDYGAYGVFCILILFLARGNRLIQLAAGCAAFWIGDRVFLGGSTETLAPLGLIPVAFYKGKRGLKLKYLFYLFYPVHLLLLYVAARMIL